MFHGKNDVCHFRAYCPQTGSKITLTASRHQLHLKTDMSYPVIEEYSQEYFEPKIGRKSYRKIIQNIFFRFEVRLLQYCYICYVIYGFII